MLIISVRVNENNRLKRNTKQTNKQTNKDRKQQRGDASHSAIVKGDS